MERSALEQLASSAEGMEVWFDSSPLIYEAWRDEYVGKAPTGEQTRLQKQLDAFFRPGEDPVGYIRGCTTNQPLALQALEADPATWVAWVKAAAREHPEWSAKRLSWETFREVGRCAAEMMLPVFKASNGRYGQVCVQVDPRLLHDTAAMVQQGIEASAASPNIMVKMPGSAEGIEGVRQLTARGIATTTTLSFSVPQLLAVAEAAEAGLRQAKADGVDLSHWRACGVMMLGRFEDHPVFKAQAEELGLTLSPEDLRWAGIAVFKKAYRLYRERGYQARLLAASMRLGPQVDGRQRIWHLEKLAGAEAVLTIFPNIIEAFIPAYAGETIASAIDEPVPADVLDKLQRVPYFCQAYDEQGMAPEEFASFPPVVATGEAFGKNMAQFDERVAEYAAR
ncbi:MAG: transaldolase family protein [Anaerolineae bacterium]